MNEGHIHGLNVEEIMEKIREEVERRKAAISEDIGKGQAARPSVVHNTVSPNVSYTFLWRFLNKIQDILPDYVNFGFVHRIALCVREHIPKYKSSFTLNDFLKYDDESFIRSAYLGILKREPDPDSFNAYLARLRRADLTKAEILGRMRYSSEGRKGQTKIKGLFPRFAILTLFRVPAIGYVINLFVSILRLPGTMRKHRT